MDHFKHRQDYWDAAFMAAALGWSQLSHCTRHKVGCVLVVDRRPIAIGINGTLPGKLNCDHVFADHPKPESPEYEEYKKKHGEWSYENEHHAEANAIDWCAKNGIATNGATVYSTLSACMPCAKTMLGAGVKRFCYLEEYDRYDPGLEHLQRGGAEIIKIEPNDVEYVLKKGMIAMFALDQKENS